MYETNYHRPTTLGEASAALAAAGGEGKYLSGGMTLIPTMKQRLASPTDLIDLRHIRELKGIAVEGRGISIGGGTTHAAIAADQKIEAICHGFHELATLIGDPAVRHMGTIGGSVANFDPAADYPAALLAMGATIHTDSREIAAEDFFLGLFETALEESEIVTAVSFDAPDASSYEKFRNPASRYAMCGAFVARRGDAVTVGITGASQSGAFLWREAGEALSTGRSLDDLSVSETDMLSDLHGSAAYRANLVKVITKRAFAKLR